ncbi:MAG: DUF4307 domain-containing protein [Actinomycetes bacterium]
MAEHPDTRFPEVPMAPAAPTRPPGRYDDAPRRPGRAAVAAIVVLAGAFGAWVLWAALGAATPDVRSELQGFTVLGSSRVRVDITATADHRSPVTCTVQAEDRNREAVGVARVTLAAGRDATRPATVVVRTRSRAVTAVIVGCRLERTS